MLKIIMTKNFRNFGALEDRQIAVACLEKLSELPLAFFEYSYSYYKQSSYF